LRRISKAKEIEKQNSSDIQPIENAVVSDMISESSYYPEPNDDYHLPQDDSLRQMIHAHLLEAINTRNYEEVT
jgi:hypothetical protein